MKPNPELLLLKRSAKIRRLKDDNARMFASSLMRLFELEDIAADPTGARAKEIIYKYQQRIERRKEIDQAEQN